LPLKFSKQNIVCFRATQADLQLHRIYVHPRVTGVFSW